jgi:HPt (histidine-containing phosphotransfer) domain-containing protein
MNLVPHSRREPAANPASGQEAGGDSTGLAEALNRMWERFLPEIRERAALLEAAANAQAIGRFSAEMRQQANAAAHKLAGTLGTFNLAHGTELAREFESLTAPANPASIDSKLAVRLRSISAEIHTIIESRS